MNDKLLDKKMNIFLFFIHFLLLCFAFKSFLLEYYSIDAYSVLFNPDQGAKFHLTNGRFVLTFCIYIFNFMHINLVKDSVFFNLLYFITVSFCIYLVCRKIESLFRRNSQKMTITSKIIVDIGVFLGFCNIFSAEWLYFNMCTIQFIVSILFAAIASVSFLSKKGCFYASLALFVSYNSYQIGLGIFVWLVLLFIYIESNGKLTKKAIFQILRAIMVCALIFIVNILIIKLLLKLNVITNVGRYQDLQIMNILHNVKNLAMYQKIIWFTGDGLTSFPLYFLFLLFTVVILFYGFAKKKDKWYDILYCLALISGGLLVTFIPTLIMPFFWCSPRQIMPLPFLFTFVIVLSLYKDIFSRLNLRYLALGSIFAFVLASIFFINIYTSDVLLINKQDRQRALYIKDAISHYEHDSGKIIGYIGFCEDKYPTWKYDLHLPYVADTCSTMFIPEWSNVNGINFYTQSSYIKIDVPENIQSAFREQNWNCFDSEQQIIFDEDKCYICNY